MWSVGLLRTSRDDRRSRIWVVPQVCEQGLGRRRPSVLIMKVGDGRIVEGWGVGHRGLPGPSVKGSVRGTAPGSPLRGLGVVHRPSTLP